MRSASAVNAGLLLGALAAAVLAGDRSSVRNQSPRGAALSHSEETRLSASLAEAFTTARYRVEASSTTRGGYQAYNAAHALQATFSPTGVTLAHASGAEGSRQSAGGRPQRLGTGVRNTQYPMRSTSVRLKAVGRGEQLAAVTPTGIQTAVNRVEYTHVTPEGASLTEWYVNAPSGLEHGFLLKEEVGVIRDEAEPLELDLALDTPLRPEVAADGERLTLRDEQGEAVLAYEKLKVWDATGRILDARMALEPANASVFQDSALEHLTTQTPDHPIPQHPALNTQLPGHKLRLQIDDSSAVYPITVDPTWTLQQKLLASDGADFDAFGISVAVSGDTAMVGAFQHAGNEGAVYVFQRTGTTWSEVQKLTGNDPGELQLFGSSVALQGDTAIIGAQAADTLLGAAHVFVRSAGTWTEQQRLVASVRTLGDFFGSAVALSGDTAVVGANGDSGAAGAAYVFVRSGTVWSQEQKFTGADTASGDGFGWSVGVSGDTAVVGARFHAHSGATDTGSAYVFVRTAGVWSEQQELGAGTFVAGDEAGIGVAVDGNTAAVGAWGADAPGLSGAGAVYVYVRSGVTWALQQRLIAGDATVNDGLGYGVALEANTLAAGASLDDDIGSAYLFMRTGTTWLQQQKLTPADGAPFDSYGTSVALSGTTVVAGSPGHDNSQGAAYVYFAPPDPPVISDARATTVGQTSATVAWTTDVAASSTVEYRVLGAGSFSTATGSAGTSHTVSLSGLTAGRTYEYRVRSITMGGSAPSSETVFPASGTLQFLTAPNLAAEVLGIGLRRLAGTIYATVTYSNASGASQSGVQLDFGVLSGSSTVNTSTLMPVSLGTVGAGSSATTTLEFGGGAGVAGSTAVITVGHSSSGGGSSASYRVTLP